VQCTPYRYLVEARNHLYMDQKMPFAGPDSVDIPRRFFEDIKRLCSLQSCNAMARFSGLVVEERSNCVVSYLYEAEPCGNVRVLLEHAIMLGLRIPLDIREMWASQMVEIVSELHARGVVVGCLALMDFDVDREGNLKLAPIKTSGWHLNNTNGNLPPEFRNIGEFDIASDATFRSDIFQLGHLIWQLAEYVPRNINFPYCSRNACTSRPCYRCTAEHTNPVALPRCVDPEVTQDPDAQVWIDACIAHCRQKDPNCRLPARELLTHIPKRPRPRQLGAWLATFNNPNYDTGTRCDECGAVALRESYHCTICELNNFDLCKHCVADGTHCWVSEHRLVRRVPRGAGLYIHAHDPIDGRSDQQTG
jgi:serine/threonine protein kinase